MGTFNQTIDLPKWWSQAGSNRRPLACHASALPAELWPHRRRGTLPDSAHLVKKMNAIRAPGPEQLTTLPAELENLERNRRVGGQCHARKNRISREGAVVFWSSRPRAEGALDPY